MCSVRNQPSAASPGSRSPSIGESGARWRAISAKADRCAAGPVAMHDDAVDDVELVGRRLQQLGRHVQRLGPDFQRRGMRRAAGHHRGARGVRADAVLDAVGLSRARPAPGGSRRPSVSAQICAIAVAKPWPTAEPPVTSSTAPVASTVIAGAVQRAEPALLDKDRDAAPDQFAGGAAAAQLGLQRLPADLRQRLVEQQRIVAGIVDDLGAERVAAAGENGISAAVIRLRRRTVIRSRPSRSATASISRSRTKRALVPAGRAVGRRRRLVGQPEMADGAIGRDAVRPGQHRRSSFPATRAPWVRT